MVDCLQTAAGAADSFMSVAVLMSACEMLVCQCDSSKEGVGGPASDAGCEGRLELDAVSSWGSVVVERPKADSARERTERRRSLKKPKTWLACWGVLGTMSWVCSEGEMGWSGSSTSLVPLNSTSSEDIAG